MTPTMILLSILKRVKSSGDSVLDRTSWAKTMEEFKSGSLRGPFYKLSDLPFPRRLVRLLLRFAICKLEIIPRICR